jgi:hypothetical protein
MAAAYHHLRISCRYSNSRSAEAGAAAMEATSVAAIGCSIGWMWVALVIRTSRFVMLASFAGPAQRALKPMVDGAPEGSMRAT